MKYQVIKDKDGYKVKYQIGDNRFDYVDTATTDCLGGCIKIWKSIKPAENWINKNCLVGKPEIEYITDK